MAFKSAAGGRATKFGIEQRGIDYVPPDERHGKPWNLLTFWGASTVQLETVVTGAVAVALGLDLVWALIAIVIGNLVGGLFMAYHSAQGPRLGVPQMIQSRAQFGFYGAMLPLLIVVLMYLGYFVVGIVIAGGAFSSLTHIGTTPSEVIVAVIMLVATWFGYDFFHRFNIVLSVASGILFLFLFVKLLTLISGAHVPAATPAFGTMILGIAVSVSYQVTYAPYVSDYSRYLPEDTGTARTFVYTYLGAAGGCIWGMSVGAIAAAIATKAFNGSPAGYLAGLTGGIKYVVLFVLLCGVLSANWQNPYGAFLTSLSTISETGKFAAGWVLRIGFTTVFAAVSLVIAFAATSHFITNLTNFLAFALVALIPWTAINLSDFYLLRRGNYMVPELFKRNGVYGEVNWLCVGLLLLTAAIEVPFINTAYFVGPIAKEIGGGDISWLVGLVFATGAYLFLAPRAAARGIAGVPSVGLRGEEFAAPDVDLAMPAAAPSETTDITAG